MQTLVLHRVGSPRTYTPSSQGFLYLMPHYHHGKPCLMRLYPLPSCHRYWWRRRPAELQEPLDNMAGSSMDDYDVLEGNYCKLRKARVLLVDYALVRLDFGFSCELSDSEIDAWLIDQFAYLSEGQIQRLHPGGDHHELLGITEVANVVDFTDRKAGIRIRSGGRAATFFVDGEYGFDAEGFPTGRMMDVKGVCAD